MANHTHILILAGGEGARFAPLSTPECPKQFLNFIGEETFVQHTYRRAKNLAPLENIYVSTNERYVDLVRKQLPDIPAENIIGEPQKKNTAPALGFCAGMIHAKDPLATMICLPSDHYIAQEDKFTGVLARAVTLARLGYLVTLGMKPDWPSTDYGYISPQNSGAEWSEVARFVEKPNTVTAEKYLREGFLWNGGIFIWQTRAFLDEVGRYAPEIYPSRTDARSKKPEARSQKQEARSKKDLASGLLPLASYFSSVPSISIDYAVMEKTRRAAVIPCDLGWSDIGTWESLKRLSANPRVQIASHAKMTMQDVLAQNKGGEQ